MLFLSSWLLINGLVIEFCIIFCVVCVGEYSSECGFWWCMVVEVGSVFYLMERYLFFLFLGCLIFLLDCRFRFWYGLIVYIIIELYVYFFVFKNVYICIEIVFCCVGYEFCVCNRFWNVVIIYYMDGIWWNDVMRFIRYKVDFNVRELV